MKKGKYVILCYNISGIGGLQQYVYNKYRYLQAQGFDVSVFSGIKGEVIIRPLAAFQKNVMEQLKYPPFVFRKAEQTSVLETMMAVIDKQQDEPILIESNGSYETLWAELLAQRYQCRHICFNVVEQQSKWYSNGFLAYLYGKYQNKELYAFNKNALRIMFQHYHPITDSQQYWFRASCSNVVDESDLSVSIPLPQADYTIGGIWRTNKEGFLETIEHILLFAKEQADKRFNIVIIGSGSEANEQKVLRLCEQQPNVHLHLTGFMYPVPLGLVKACDVFVSTAGSSRIPCQYGVPSITVTTATTQNGIEFIPLGILDYTTRNTVNPVRIQESLSDLLSMVLFEAYCSTHERIGVRFASDDSMGQEFAKQLTYYDTALDQVKNDVSTIRPESRLQLAYSVVGHLFGIRILSILDGMGHALKEKLKKLKNR